MAFELVYDLDADFKGAMRSNLQAIGVKRVGKDEDIEMTFLNAERKHIAANPRQVLRSDVLMNCPESIQSDLEVLLLKAERGEDLSEYLPRDAKKWDYLDGLLNDWGIHHLHFYSKSARSQDTNFLLLARVTAETFHAITVTGHRKWTDPELIEILKRNWPETIHVINQGAVSAEQQAEIRRLNLQQRISAHEHEQLRKAGIMSSVVTEDGSLTMPTLGINSKGHSNEDAIRSLQLNRTLKFLKQILPNELPSLLQKARREPLSGSINLKMVAMDAASADFQVDDGARFRLSWPLVGDKIRLTMEVFPST